MIGFITTVEDCNDMSPWGVNRDGIGSGLQYAVTYVPVSET